MQGILDTLLSTSRFIPHGHCYLWEPGLVWLHLLSDLLIALAYFSIPLSLLYFVRQREDVPFRGMFILFGAFIVSCGTTHFMSIVTLWYPTYWLSGVIKALTALISFYTALELVPVIPQALALPSPARLEAMNLRLEQEVTDRKFAEAEVRQLNIELEGRVKERTMQLEAINREKEELLQREQAARTQAEQAKEEMQIYAERLSLALDAAKMGSWDWNMMTNQVFWTVYHETILGYEPGTPKRSYEEWIERVHPDDRARAETALQEARDHHQEYYCEYRAVLPQGEIRWLSSFGRFYYDVYDRPVRMVGVLSDITERKQAEARLRESEERFRSTFEQAAVGMAHVELDGRLIRVNQKFCDIVGYSRDEIYQKTFQDITYADDLDTDLYQANRLVKGETENYSLEKRYVRKDGSLVWVEITVSLLRDASRPDGGNGEQSTEAQMYGAVGQPKYFIGVVEEIGDRKEAETALQKRAEELSWTNRLMRQTTALLKQRNQELDEFAYIVSHDLKAPLRAIANLSEWIEEDLMGQLPEENQHQLHLLRQRVYRMESLINGLLEYSRVGRVDTDMGQVDLKTLLVELIDSLDPPATFTIDIDPAMPTFTTKTLLLRQVFANLISNAIKHHDRPDGHIKILVEDQLEQYKFIVTDDGTGIAPEHHHKIFGIFQTLASSKSEQSTGIGLSIVKKIVESENGTIGLDSQLGKGTAFYFTWPKQAPRLD